MRKTSLSTTITFWIQFQPTCMSCSLDILIYLKDLRSECLAASLWSYWFFFYRSQRKVLNEFWTYNGSKTPFDAFLVKDLHDPFFKGGVVIDNIFLLMKTIEYKGEYRYKYLDQTIFSYCDGMAFERHHYLYTSFDEKIQQLTTGGFIEHWIEKYTKHRNITEKPPPPDLVVLNMDRLNIGFQIWIIMLGISFMAFIGELLHYWAPKLYYLWIFKYILRGFYELSY